MVTAFLGRTPHHLGKALAQGEHRQGPLRAEKFPGGVIAVALHLHLGGEAGLLISPSPEGDAQAFAAGGAAPFGDHRELPLVGL